MSDSRGRGDARSAAARHAGAGPAGTGARAGAGARGAAGRHAARLRRHARLACEDRVHQLFADPRRRSAVYRFWGKTRVRRYLWGRVSFQGDRAEYTGTGRELPHRIPGRDRDPRDPRPACPSQFDGRSGPDHPVYWAARGASMRPPSCSSSSSRCTARGATGLSRTEWRGIRFVQDGSSVRYALLAFGWGNRDGPQPGDRLRGLSHPPPALPNHPYQLRGSAFRVRRARGRAARALASDPAASGCLPWVSCTSGTG